MTLDAALLALPVAMPLLAAGVSLLLSPFPTAQRILGVGVVLAVLLDAAFLLHRAHTQDAVVTQVGGYRVPLGITLVGDRFSALMLLVSSAVLLAVLVYAIGQGTKVDRPGAVPSVFHPAYLVQTAGVSLAFLTGDLFNLFVALEVMLMASYALITLGATRSRVRAGMTYIVTSLLSSILLLTSVGLVYGFTGTLNLAELSRRTAELPAEVQAWLSVMLLVSLATKAAIVPLHWWLPESYPPAPAPVTAVFAALLTKVAVYAIIRTQSLLFPRDEPWVLLLALAAVTLLVGVTGALTQTNAHGMLSFLLVSHIGFMLLGLGVSTAAGAAGAVVYLVHHILVQASLFMLVGLIEHHRGTASLPRLGGLATTAPVCAILFLLPALSLGGVPPLAGFLGKLAVLEAAVGADDPAALTTAGVAILTSLLTLAVMGRFWTKAFWGPPMPMVLDETTDDDARPEGETERLVTEEGQPGEKDEPRTPPTVPLMTAAAGAVVALGLGVAVAAGPLTEIAFQAGEDLRAGDAYRAAVLGGGGR